MSFDPNLQMRVLNFHGVLLGELSQWDPDDYLRPWEIGIPATTFPTLIPSTELSHQLLSQPLAVCDFQVVECAQAESFDANWLTVC